MLNDIFVSFLQISDSPRAFTTVRRDLFSSKRQRDEDDSDADSPLKRQRHQLDDCFAGEETKYAVEKLQATEQNLVGDGSKTHSLPTIETRNHRDLKTITSSTVNS